MKYCVFCNLPATATSGMSITLNNGFKIEARLCEEHSESSTVKAVRQAYEEKYINLDQYISSLEELGYTVLKPGEVVLTQTPIKQPAATTTMVTKPKEELYEEGLISTDKFDSVKFNPTIITQGAVPAAPAGLNANALSEKISPAALKGSVKVGVTEGRVGMPITFQERRVDGLGTTHISINKSVTDTVLQESFKRMAKDSIADGGPDFARGGYSATTKNCPICKSQGLIRQNGQDITCPKCQGAGIID